MLPRDVAPLAPCLAFIGVDESNDLIKKASSLGFDALIVYEVEVKLNRVNGVINNDGRVRLIDLKDPKSKRSYSGSKLNNVQVARDIEKGDKPIDSVVKMVIKKTRENFALQEMPSALTAEIIKTKRLPTLVSDRERSKIELLSEVNLYYSMGLIDSSDKTAAFEKILGPDGNALATGGEEEKLKILEKLIERELD